MTIEKIIMVYACKYKGGIYLRSEALNDPISWQNEYGDTIEGKKCVFLENEFQKELTKITQ